jgi:hypothetical protein
VQAWLQKLNEQRETMPLKEPQVQLSDLAQSFWQWSKIAGYYSDIFRTLCKKT